MACALDKSQLSRKKDAVVSRSFIRMLCHTICSRIEKMKKMMDACKRVKESYGGQESRLENLCLGL